MKKLTVRQILGVVCIISLSGSLISLLNFQTALGALPAPQPLLPRAGTELVTPTFTWLAVSGAAKYEVQIGPQSDPNLAYLTLTSRLLELTPADAANLANTPLYWKVRAIDAANAPGEWSPSTNFKKIITAPALLSPLPASAVSLPAFSWAAVDGAAYYRLEISQSPSFAPVGLTYTSYNTSLTPVDPLAPGTYYWRVTGMDAHDHAGTPSQAWVFTQDLPPPVLKQPANFASLAQVALTWQPRTGAYRYQVDLSLTEDFTNIPYTFLTTNSSLIPSQTVLPGAYFWRACSLDSGGNQGTCSLARRFTLRLPAPQPLSPAANTSISLPAFSWQTSVGAVSYVVELSSEPGFIPVLNTFTTYNSFLIPSDNLAPGVYYWRVRGRDAAGNPGENSTGIPFTLLPPPAGSGAVNLLYPLEGETMGGDPAFRWSAFTGANTYRLKVSQKADFSTSFDQVLSYNSAYMPYTPGYKDTYPNGGYYWKVEALNKTGGVIAVSSARSFIKAAPLSLVNPPPAARLTDDPLFTWLTLAGARSYRLTISQTPAFSSSYDQVLTPNLGYSPYTPGYRDTYAVGVYYWQVEALDIASSVIAVSETFSFTKQTALDLIGPINQSGLGSNPTFRWQNLAGGFHYNLQVSTQPNLSSSYDQVLTNYPEFSPYTPGLKDSYQAGTYYWKVTAKDSSGRDLAASQVYTFTRRVEISLLEPLDQITLGGTPSFRWRPLVGTDHYRLKVSTSPSFSSSYDTVLTDYTSYTPYTPGLKDSYANGVYYWKIEALDATGVVLGSSQVRTFTTSGSVPTSTPAGAPTATITPTPTLPPPPTATPNPAITPTPLGSLVDAGQAPTGQKTLGAVVVYADTFSDLGSGFWEASGNVRLGSSQKGYFALGPEGKAYLDYTNLLLNASNASLVSLILDNNKLAPLFAGGFRVDPTSGALNLENNVVFHLDRVGDLGINLSTPLLNFKANALLGTAGATASVTVYPIEGNSPLASLGFTLNHDGSVSGDIDPGSLQFVAAALNFSVERCTFSYTPGGSGRLTIYRASVTLPEAFDLGGEGWVEMMTISSAGIQVGAGGVKLTLPEMAVPGTDDQFSFGGGEVTLSLLGGGKYEVTGEMSFDLLDIQTKSSPGQSYSGSIYARIRLDNSGLRYILIGGTVEPGIPIGNTGVVLTGLEGSVTLPEILIQITGTLQTQMEVPPLGPLLSGSPAVWVQLGDDPGLGLRGSLKVLVFDAANAALSISQSNGLQGSVDITYPPPYPISGAASLHVWKAGGEFHFTGSATVSIGFKKGSWYQDCWSVCLWSCYSVCVNVPPLDFTMAEAACELGEFCVDGNCASTVYGFKGTASALDGWWEESFFLDVSGSLSYGDDASQYALYNQSNGLYQALAARAAENNSPIPNLPYRDTYTVTVGNTDQTLFMLAWKAGSPNLSLQDPNGHTLTPGIDANLYYTSVITNSYYVVHNPLPGTWRVNVENVTVNDYYVLNVLGSNFPPNAAITDAQLIGANLYNIVWNASDPDDAPTLALYYDSDQTGADGKLIASGLDPASGSYVWDASLVESGSYYLYARIDDLRNAPVTSYYSQTIQVANTLPPAAPKGLQGRWVFNNNRADLCWERSPEPDVTAYRVYAGTRPGVYDLGVWDAYNNLCYSIPLQSWMSKVYLAVSAVDNSGNASPLTGEVVAARLIRIYTPILKR